MTPETTLITGASSGIGLALAHEFAGNGHGLVLVARSRGKLAAAAEGIEARYPVRCRWIDADLAEEGAPERIFDQLQRDGVEVGALVNNAGVMSEGNFAGIDLAQHRQMIHLNIGALTAMTHLFLRPMRERRHGRVVQIASTSAFNPVPSLVTYAASKAYVLSFGEGLALELRGSGVSVTTVCPGFTETPMIVQGGRKPMRLPLVPNMTAEAVARETYRAAMRGRPLQINGWGNQAVVGALRLPPLWLRREIISLIMRLGV